MNLGWSLNWRENTSKWHHIDIISFSTALTIEQFEQYFSFSLKANIEDDHFKKCNEDLKYGINILLILTFIMNLKALLMICLGLTMLYESCKKKKNKQTNLNYWEWDFKIIYLKNLNKILIFIVIGTYQSFLLSNNDWILFYKL